jgi:hypothetical protein
LSPDFFEWSVQFGCHRSAYSQTCVFGVESTGLFRKGGGQCPPYAPHSPVGRALPAVFVCRWPAQPRDDSEYLDLWHPWIPPCNRVRERACS